MDYLEDIVNDELIKIVNEVVEEDSKEYNCELFYDLLQYARKIFFDWNKEKETIICSAIKTATGFVIRGHRHCDSIRTARSIKALTRMEILQAEQGFITSKNRFVGRKEAKILFDKSGAKSVDKSGYVGDELYSEDLY
jgi:hypothetical protein